MKCTPRIPFVVLGVLTMLSGAGRVWMSALPAAASCLDLRAFAASEAVVVDSQLIKDQQCWTGGFADLPTEPNETYELEFGRKQLPIHLSREGTPIKAMYIAGSNRSDGLFMFIKRQMTELKPHTNYQLRYFVRIATDSPSGCFGAGGPPGEAVVLKAGGSTEEPMPLDIGGWKVLNVDKGNQDTGGKNALVLGHIGNTSTDCLNRKFEFKDFSNEDNPLEATTDRSGNLWLLVGTDSGYEGKTALYYSRIRVTLTEN